MLDTHRRHVADATVAVLPVSAEQTSGFGILKVNRQGRIVHFEEKPGPERLAELESEIPGYGKGYLASMGIYMFSREALERATSDSALVDFGRHVIPQAIGEQRVQAHLHRGYWEDVGTIRSYYAANLALCQPVPPFDFYEAAKPVFTHPRFLPATKIESCSITNALISEGSIVVKAEIERAVVGIRSRIGPGVQLRDSLVLGADHYETLDEIARSGSRGVPPIGIGEGSLVERAIIDKNVRIGRGVRIQNREGVEHQDGAGYYVREGIVVIPKNGIVPDGTVI
jgi:glucose-1-phosphate adenylyltransferase